MTGQWAVSKSQWQVLSPLHTLEGRWDLSLSSSGHALCFFLFCNCVSPTTRERWPLHTALMFTVKRSAHIEHRFLGQGTWLTHLTPTPVQSPWAISHLFLPPQQCYLLFVLWVIGSCGLFSIWPFCFLSFRNISADSITPTASTLPCFPLLVLKYSLYIILKELH